MARRHWRDPRLPGGILELGVPESTGTVPTTAEGVKRSVEVLQRGGRGRRAEQDIPLGARGGQPLSNVLNTGAQAGGDLERIGAPNVGCTSTPTT